MHCKGAKSLVPSLVSLVEMHRCCNHSCQQNAATRGANNFTFHVYALRDIKKGEEVLLHALYCMHLLSTRTLLQITVSYGVDGGVAERQRLLKSRCVGLTSGAFHMLCGAATGSIVAVSAACATWRR